MKISNNVELNNTWFFEMVETNEKESWDMNNEIYVRHREIGLFRDLRTCEKFQFRENEEEYYFAKKCINYGEFRNRPSGIDGMMKTLKELEQKEQ